MAVNSLPAVVQQQVRSKHDSAVCIIGRVPPCLVGHEHPFLSLAPAMLQAARAAFTLMTLTLRLWS